MSGFKVEKNIPMPKDARGRRKGTSKYPWRDMQVGDSFLMPKKGGGKPHAVAFMISKQATAECGSRRKFKSAKTDDGFRIWRIE